MTEPQPTYTADEQVYLPRKAVNLARRALNVLGTRNAAQLMIIVINDAWYVSINGGEPERLG